MNNDYPATFLIVYGWELFIRILNLHSIWKIIILNCIIGLSIQTDNDATGPYSSLIILVQYMKNRGAMPP